MVAVAGLLGCPTLPVPADVALVCSADDECPSGFLCRGLRGEPGRCLPVDAERQPPALDPATTLSPTLAGVDAEVVVQLVASEPLARSPDIELQLGDVRRAFTLDPDDENTENEPPADGTRVTARTRILASDPSGNAQVFATLTDTAENTAVLLVGVITIDTTAPALAQTTTSSAAVTDGDTLHIALTADEPLDRARVQLAVGGVDGAPIALDIDDDGPASAADTVDATLVVDERVPEGPLVLDATLVDAAGNDAAVAVDATVLVDRTAPTLFIESAADIVRGGQTMLLSFRSDEPLGVAPTATLVDPAAGERTVSLSARDDRFFTAAQIVDASIGDGTWTWRIDGGRDAAGNAAGRLEHTVRVDQTAPSFLEPPNFAPARISRVADFDAATLRFAVDEPSAASVVLADGASLACTGDDDAQKFTCALDAAAVVASGPQTAFVTVVDGAGNVAFSAAGFMLDDVAPLVLATAVTRAPPDGAVVPAITSLGDGARLTVAVSVDDLDADVTLVASDADLAFDRVSPDGVSPFVFAAAVSASVAEGPVRLVIALVDDVGNRAAVDLGAVVVDRTPPSAPAVDTPDAVVLRRTPWGDGSGGDRFALSIAPVVDPDAALAIAWARARHEPQDELGRAALTNSGANIPLGAADRSEVFVTFVDAAGNETDAVVGGGVDAFRVRDVVWTATLGDKVPGSTVANPHAFLATPASLDQLVVVGAAEAGGARTAVRDDSSVTTTSAATAVRAGDGGATAPSVLARVAWDAARGRLVAFDFLRPDVWEHDGHRWRPRSSVDPEGDGDPRDRQGGAALVYDPVRAETLLFGGDRNPAGDYWAWNGASWRRVAGGCNQTPTVCPPERNTPAVAWDETRGVVVVFGGGVIDHSTGERRVVPLSDTWLWDGERFTLACDGAGACPSPPARVGAALVEDRARGVLVLFGGHDGVGPLDDTWEWDGEWRERAPSTSPPPRSFASAAFDDEAGAVLVAGGGAGPELPPPQLPNDGALGDAWHYDGARDTWTPVAFDGLPARSSSSAAATPDGVLVFGGNDLGFVDGERLLRLRNGAARALTSAEHPQARALAAMAFDDARGRTVLFGGSVRGRVGDRLVDDAGTLWEWDGEQWATPVVAGDGLRPAARAAAAMAYDRRRGVTVLFGGENVFGCDGEGALCRAIVWEWNGTAWSAIDTTGAGPAPRQGHAMTWDDERGVVVLFGGKPDVDYGSSPPATGCDGRDRCDTVWEWDGSAWTGVIPEDAGDGIPPGREGHALGFDPLTREVLLVGGSRQFMPSAADAGGFGACETCGFTWLWNGTRWRVASQDPGVTIDESRRAVTDLDRSRLVVVGRNIDGSAALDVREWDGAAWSAVPLVDPEGDGTPLGGLAPAVAWDSQRGVVVVVGGDAFDGVRDDATWLVDLGGRRAVGQQFSFTFAAAGAPADVALRELRLDVDAHGERLLRDGSATAAAELFVWDGRWRRVDSGTEPLAFATTNPVEIGRLLVGASRTVNLSVRGAPTGDAATTTIATDRAALTLRYRLAGGAR